MILIPRLQLAFLVLVLTSYSFSNPNLSLDDLKSLLDSYQLDKPSPNHRFQLTSASGLTLDLQVQSQVNFPNGIDYYGVAEGIPQSGFSLELRNGTFQGEVILTASKQVFEIVETLDGKLNLIELVYQTRTCVETHDHGEDGEGNPLKPTPTYTIPSAPANINSLESNPDAPGVVLLDRDGYYLDESWWVSNYGTQNLAAANITDDDFYAIYLTISEDFAPINLNVTSSEAVYNSYPSGMRTRVVITNETFTASSTGWARIGGFDNETSSVCFRNGFSGSQYAYMLAEVCSHELGHSLGLSHDGDNTTSYYRGHGSGAVSTRLWGPLMGSTYSTDISHFSKGEYSNANNTQDDYSIMTSATYALGYEPDDHGDDTASASPLQIESDGAVLEENNFGLISTQADLDYFSFTTSGGSVDFQLLPAIYKPNLDAQLELLDDQGTIIESSNPNSIAVASISTTLQAGTYYLRVDGVGYLTSSTGYSDYGSRGRYVISGNISGTGSVSSVVVSSSAMSSSVDLSSSSSLAVSSISQASDCDSLAHCVDDMNSNWNGGDRCHYDGKQWEADHWVNTTPGVGVAGWILIGECQKLSSSNEISSSSLEASSSSEMTVGIEEGLTIAFAVNTQAEGFWAQDIQGSTEIHVYNSLGHKIESHLVHHDGFYHWTTHFSRGWYYGQAHSQEGIQSFRFQVQ